MLGGRKEEEGLERIEVLCVGDGPGICRGASEWISPRVSQGRHE